VKSSDIHGLGLFTKKLIPIGIIWLKDIQPGEEIKEDYSKYTLCSWLEKYKEYFDPCCW